MVDNKYNYLGKDYSIGAVINGELDGVVFTGGQPSEVFDVVLADGYKVSLSNKYGLFVLTANQTFVAIKASEVVAGQLIYIASSTNFETKAVQSVTKRMGKEVTIPKTLFVLNGVYVTTQFRNENYDAQVDAERKSTCIHRSKEQKVYKVHYCCSPEQERLDYFCEAKQVLLIQPQCWKCELYKKKEDNV
jgi:hypothetical protein